MPLPCEGAAATVARLGRGVSEMCVRAGRMDPGGMHHATPGTSAQIEPVAFLATGGALPPWRVSTRSVLAFPRHAYLGGLAATVSSTIRGSRIVKVEPLPGSLFTVMSPPII